MNLRRTSIYSPLRSLRKLQVVLLSLITCALSLSAAKQPNIIFFLVDDYDKPEASPYGGNVLTPNLDRLAREGMLFNNAYVTSTVCTPSRYTMLTGRYAGSSHSNKFLKDFPLGTQSLPGFNVALEDDNMNVGAVLAQNGYATGFVGKYHVGPEHDEGYYQQHGIQSYAKNAEYTEQLNKHKFNNEKIYRELIKERGFTWAKNIYWGNMKAPFKGHNPEWTTAAAVEFLEEHKNQPFYLHVCSTLLHGPNREWHSSLTTKELMSGEGILKKPINSQPSRESVLKRVKEAGLTEEEVGYTWMDDSVGVLLDKLDELGIADNTIFVFVADHGSNNKGSVFRTRGMEVPCIIRWPNGIKAGTVTDELMQSTDFVATWFDVTGAKVPEGYPMDGISFSSLFKTPNKPYREYIYGEMGSARAIKTKEWNLVTLRYPEEIIAGGDRKAKALAGLSAGISRAGYSQPHACEADQLYNLVQDPTEQNNLAYSPEYASQLKSMKQELTKILKQFPDRPYGELVPGGNARGPEETEQILQSVKKYYEPESKDQKSKKSKQNKKSKKSKK
ncbi:MAG: sulfatase family protein [Coraliomargarita sp.]